MGKRKQDHYGWNKAIQKLSVISNNETVNKPKIAKPMMVKLPEMGDLWKDSGEGGLAFYFVVKKNDYTHDRCVCISSGSPMWGNSDVIIFPRDKAYKTYGMPLQVDCAMLIGSTRRSLWNDFEGEYFHATPKTLTPDGELLYEILRQMYGQVDIVTLLDT